MEFQQRSEQFQQEIDQLQKKYSVQLYAAYVLLQNGEMMPLIKLKDLLPQDTIVDLEKKYENKPKTRSVASEKA